MFERMEIAESIYEVVVGPIAKKTTREYATRADLSRQNRGETTLSTM